MSQLQKKMEKIQRPEGPRLGFGPVSREKPRAMLLGVLAASVDEARAAQSGGADVVLLQDATPAAVKDAVGEGACVGALVDSLDEAGAAALKEAGCDFAVAAPAATLAAAVNGEAMGHVVQLSLEEPESFLRGLAPLGLDGLYVGEIAGALTLAQQVDLVRTASMAGAPLIVRVQADVTSGHLRMLRDSGVGVVLAPAGADLAALDAALRAVPPPRSARKGQRDLALVPSVATGHDDHDHDDDE